MSSSSSVTLRALVMLVCLIAVPLLAVSGTSLPRMVKDAIRGPAAVHPPRASQPAAAEPPRGSDAPPFVPAVRLPQRETAQSRDAGPPLVAVDQPRTLSPATNKTPTGTAPLWGPAAPRADTAQTQAMGPGAGSHSSTNHDGPVGDVAARDRATHSANGPRYSQSGASADQSAMAGDRFAAVGRRLRELGASYYLLETWGERGEQFRFHCKMAPAGKPDSARDFEATNRDAIAAMQKVLEQVEAWRGLR